MNPNNLSQTEWVSEAMRRFEGPLLRYAASVTGDAELARDVVQEAFIKLCEADRGKIDSRLAPWLYTVVRNRAINVRRKEARMAPLLEGQAEALANGQDGPVEVAEKREAHRLVSGALRQLPGNQQEACRLKFQNGLTYREISEIMGVSLGTVSNLIAQALDAVRLELQAKNGLAQEG